MTKLPTPPKLVEDNVKDMVEQQLNRHPTTTVRLEQARGILRGNWNKTHSHFNGRPKFIDSESTSEYDNAIKDLMPCLEHNLDARGQVVPPKHNKNSKWAWRKNWDEVQAISDAFGPPSENKSRK